MLSFLKDGQSIPASQADSSQGSQEPALTGKDDYLTVAGHGKKLRQSTLLLAIVFAVGAAGVFVMIKKAAPSRAAAATVKDAGTDVGEVIAQLNGMQTEVNKQMKSVAGRLNHLSEVGQIPVTDLKKNPFKLEASGDQLVVEVDNEKKNMETRIRKAAGGLQLWSVTSSPRGDCCMINDKVLYMDDAIDGFTVRKITNTAVVVEQQGFCVELKIN